MKVAILDDYPGAVESLRAYQKLAKHEVQIFRDHLQGPALAQRLAGFEAVVLLQQRCPIDAAVLKALPALRFISQTGRNLSHLDVEAATQQGIVISAGGAGPPFATAELTWALILASRRGLVAEANALQRGQWQTQIGAGLAGQNLGIYAFGRIGSAVARVGRAFGMRVVCWGRQASLARAQAEGFERASAREAFFEEMDVVSIHLPLSQQTQGLVGAEDLGRMKRDALLVNTSRAGLIGDAVLAAALDRGRPGFAAVDVYEHEPIAADHPLLGRPNVLMTPHLGYVERSTYEQYFEVAFDQVNAFAAGAPINLVTASARP
ncbi:MAG: D-2-hydroxyacid dehydrogenase family protein [Myxococcota bacterium]